MLVSNHERIQIAGAGPAGLAAAITLAHAGKKVMVHEARSNVGWRFKRDFQGLENWTTKQDVLQVFKDSGLTTDFDYLPCNSGVLFDNVGHRHDINSEAPIFYLIERGPMPGSLDYALLTQAQQLGVEVRFNSRVKNLPYPAILATGPKAADALAVGYHFDTDMDDGYWVICDDKLAPGGYAYLLIWNGRGTIKSCMFADFSQSKLYAQRTVEAFQKRMGLEMKDPVAHSGVGNFYIPTRAYAGKRPIVGEQAGFQDTLWGFGMRHAIHSGILAAQSIQNGTSYDVLWKKNIKGSLKASVVNRALFELLGNRGYRWFFKHLARRKDVRKYLYRQYHPTAIKSLFYPWAKSRVLSFRKELACDHVDCDCVQDCSKCG